MAQYTLVDSGKNQIDGDVTVFMKNNNRKTISHIVRKMYQQILLDINKKN